MHIIINIYTYMYICLCHMTKPHLVGGHCTRVLCSSAYFYFLEPYFKEEPSDWSQGTLFQVHPGQDNKGQKTRRLKTAQSSTGLDKRLRERRGIKKRKVTVCPSRSGFRTTQTVQTLECEEVRSIVPVREARYRAGLFPPSLTGAVSVRTSWDVDSRSLQ